MNRISSKMDYCSLKVSLQTSCHLCLTDSPGIPPSAGAHQLFRGFSFVAPPFGGEDRPSSTSPSLSVPKVTYVSIHNNSLYTVFAFIAPLCVALCTYMMYCPVKMPAIVSVLVLSFILFPSLQRCLIRTLHLLTCTRCKNLLAWVHTLCASVVFTREPIWNMPLRYGIISRWCCIDMFLVLKPTFYQNLLFYCWEGSEPIYFYCCVPMGEQSLISPSYINFN